MPPPPTPTLFPYTTLFRSQWHHPFEHQADFKAHFPADFICEGVDQTRGWFYSLLAIGVTAFDALVYKRSEEHTSELQSRRDLVCRLRLEKKKRHLYVWHAT